MYWTRKRIAGMNETRRIQLLTAAFQWVREDAHGMLPFKAYEERVRTWHTVFVDVAVVARFGHGLKGIEILLQRRPNRPPYLYPGMYDVPGGNFLHRETVEDAAARIATDLGFGESDSRPDFAGVGTYVKTEAEIGTSFLFVVELPGVGSWPAELPNNGEVFSLDKLPDGVVPWQEGIYPDMIRAFFSEGVSTIAEYLGKD